MISDDLEKQVYGGILAAIGEAVKNHLSQGWSKSPLDRVLNDVLTRREPELRALIDEAVTQSFVGFRDNLREAASHKLARVLMSKAEGEIEKRANELRSDPAFRARLTLAIESAIKETRNP